MQVGLQLIIVVSISEPVWPIVLNWTLCPDRSQWDLRAASFCTTSAPSYACLFDANNIVYTEFCIKESEIQRPGYQFVIRGALDDRECDRNRYQPFKLTTNGQSQCIFKKSKCTEEGQIEYHNGTTTSDRLCRCDYTNFYSFSKKYGDPCFCNPSEEDCSCYKTNCPEGYVLSTGLSESDNTCIEWERLTESYHCPEIKSKEIPNDVPIKEKAPLKTYSPGASSSSNLIGWILFYCLPSVTCVLFVVIYFCGWKDIIPNAETQILQEQIDDIVSPDELQSFTLPENVDDIRLGQIDDWKNEDKHMHVTVAMQKVTKLLEKNKFVTVVGPTASGKSTLIRHVALLWQDKGYKLVPIISKHHKHKPLELLKCNNRDSQKKIFVIDDLCGVDYVDVVAIDVWISHFKNLTKLITNENYSVKILMSCRVSIFESNQFRGLAFMIGQEYRIHKNHSSLEEKKSILKKHIQKENVDKVSHLLEKCVNYFPLLCKIAGKKQEGIQKELFSHQNETIERDISEMPDEEFISVFVCVLFGEFKDDWIDAQTRPKGVNTAIQCLLNKCVHLPSKDEALQKLPIKEGAYVKKSRNGFSLVHRVISDIVFVKCDERAEDVFLQYASSSFIATRYRFMSINQDPESMETAISNKKQYFERLKLDLKNGDLDSTFHNKQLKYKTFRTKMIEFIKSDNEMINTLENLETERNPLIESAMEGYNDLVDMLIDIRGRDVNITDIRGRTPLHIAVEMGYQDVAEALLEHGAKDVEDKHGRTPLSIAQNAKNVPIVKMMIKRSNKTAD